MSSHLHKCRESRVVPLLFLKRILAIHLVSAIVHKGFELRHDLLEDIANLSYDGVLFLSFRKCIPELGVDVDNSADIPEDLTDELFTSIDRNNIRLSDTRDPNLEKQVSEGHQGERANEQTSLRYSISFTKSFSV